MAHEFPEALDLLSHLQVVQTEQQANVAHVHTRAGVLHARRNVCQWGPHLSRAVDTGKELAPPFGSQAELLGGPSHSVQALLSPINSNMFAHSILPPHRCAGASHHGSLRTTAAKAREMNRAVPEHVPPREHSSHVRGCRHPGHVACPSKTCHAALQG